MAYCIHPAALHYFSMNCDLLWLISPYHYMLCIFPCFACRPFLRVYACEHFSVNIYSERWGFVKIFWKQAAYTITVNIWEICEHFLETKFLFLLFPCLLTFCRVVKIAVFKGTKSATVTCFSLFQFIAVCSQFVATCDSFPNWCY